MDITRRQALGASLAATAVLPLSRALAQNSGPLTIQIAIFDGFEVTDALAPYDLLKVSEKVGARFQTSLVTLCGEGEVNALDDVRIKPNAGFDWSADMLLVPGAPSLWRQGIQPRGVNEVLPKWRAMNKPLVTVCTGGLIAARAGVLTGRNVTTHHAAFEAIQEHGVNLIRARVVDDGDILSCGGVTSGIDLALHLIERHYGAQLAIATEQIFEYERRGTVWRAP
jgi:transcriptional regulator GlxA family with amidase domain